MLEPKVPQLRPLQSPSLLISCYRRVRRFLGSPRRSTASAPPRRGIPLLRRPLRRREGGGSPSPACTYGRVGWGSRRRLLGGGGAGGGWFGVGGAFSGGGALRSSSSPRSTWWCSTPGVVLERRSFSSDPGRRIWRPDPRVLRVHLLPPATDPEAAEARRRRPRSFSVQSFAAARRTVKAASSKGKLHPRQW